MNDEFALDCSVTMAWFFEGEATPATDALLDQLNKGGQGIVRWFLRLVELRNLGAWDCGAHFQRANSLGCTPGVTLRSTPGYWLPCLWHWDQFIGSHTRGYAALHPGLLAAMPLALRPIDWVANPGLRCSPSQALD